MDPLTPAYDKLLRSTNTLLVCSAACLAAARISRLRGESKYMQREWLARAARQRELLLINAPFNRRPRK